MNRGIKMRLAALGAGLAIIGVAIVVVTLILQSLAATARTRLSQVDLESFRISDHFHDKLRYTNDKMRRYATTEQPAAWEEFLVASQELKAWIKDEEARLTEQREKRILGDMTTAFAAYMQRAEDLKVLMTSDTKTGASLSEYNSFFEQSRRFLDLGEQLGRVHYESRNLILASATRTLTALRFSTLGLVALLFVFGAALARGVYKDLISPLRVKLVESQATAERHEKLASLGLLAAGVAHELRTPLTAIKTALFIQQKKFEPGSAAYKDGQFIEKEMLRLERIVNQFLQFARPARPEPATIPAETALQEVQTLFSPELAKSEIRILREDGRALRIKADPGQLKQVLINLVQNAADSIGRNGTITLRARAERRRIAEDETDVVILEVADTGKGIPPEVEKRLFDPFFTTKENGTGLGLPLAARMVEVNGGALQYQTQVNHGSTFGVVLPRAT